MDKHFTSNNSEELIEKIRNHYSSEGKALSKSQIYKRLDKAGVKAHKQNGKCWLDKEQFKALENLDKHIKSGGSMQSFGAMVLQTKNDVETQEFDKETEVNDEIIAEEILVLDRRAQEKAAGILIAENLITADYLKNYQLLDEDLRAEVEASKGSYFPKVVCPKNFAQTALEKIRKQRVA